MPGGRRRREENDGGRKQLEQRTEFAGGGFEMLMVSAGPKASPEPQI